MKKRIRFALYLAVIGTLSIVIVSCAQSHQTVNVPISNTPAMTTSPAETISVVKITAMPSCEIISPSQIRKGNAVFKIDTDNTRLTEDELDIEIYATETLPAEILPSHQENMVSDLELSFPPTGQTLQVDPFGGGGGGPALVNGVYIADQSFSYHIKPHLTKGENVHITAIVSFSDFIGIPEPVKFNLDLTVE